MAQIGSIAKKLPPGPDYRGAPAESRSRNDRGDGCRDGVVTRYRYLVYGIEGTPGITGAISSRSDSAPPSLVAVPLGGAARSAAAASPSERRCRRAEQLRILPIHKGIIRIAVASPATYASRSLPFAAHATRCGLTAGSLRRMSRRIASLALARAIARAELYTAAQPKRGMQAADVRVLPGYDSSGEARRWLARGKFPRLTPTPYGTEPDQHVTERTEKSRPAGNS